MQLRILQGYFDGHLNVQMSRLYNFDVSDHQEVMDLFVRWLMPMAHGDTTLSLSCPGMNTTTQETISTEETEPAPHQHQTNGSVKDMRRE